MQDVKSYGPIYKYRRNALVLSWVIVFILGLIAGVIVGSVIVTVFANESSENGNQKRIRLNIPGNEAVIPVVVPGGTEHEPKLKSLGEFRLTAYCSCEKCCGIWAVNRPKDENGKEVVYTASGSVAVSGVTIAADTNVLPFGTKVFINGHEYIVQDRGGAIKDNQIDIYFDDHQEALIFGVQYQEVFIIEEE